MRFSWKPLLANDSLEFQWGAPPLGLMRFSWKQNMKTHRATQNQNTNTPPLGLMRFSWKPDT